MRSDLLKLPLDSYRPGEDAGTVQAMAEMLLDQFLGKGAGGALFERRLVFVLTQIARAEVVEPERPAPPTIEQVGAGRVGWREVIAEWARLLFRRAPRWHYYGFAFKDAGLNGWTDATVYIGHATRRITKLDISRAKEAAGVGQGACLVSCYYLGRMTHEQMTGERPA